MEYFKKIYKKSSTYLKILIFSIILCIIGMGIIITMSISTISRIFHENITNIAQSEKLIYSNEVENWFVTATHTLRNFASILSFLPTEEYFQDIATIFVKENDFIENTFIAFSDETFINGRGQDLPESNSITERPWFHYPRKAEPYEIIISTTYRSLVNENTTVAIATYLPQLGGIGASVSITIHLDYILEEFQNSTIIGDGYLILLDSNMQIIIHCNQYYTPNSDGFTHISEIPNGDILYEAIQNRLCTGTFTDNSVGDAYFLINTLDLGSTDWTIIAVTPSYITNQQVMSSIVDIMIPVSILVFSLFVIIIVITLKVIGYIEKETALLNSLFNSVPDIIFVKNENLEFERVNRAFEKQFNLDEESILGLRDKEALNLPDFISESWRKSDTDILNNSNEIDILRIEEPVPDAFGNIQTFETIKTKIKNSKKAIGVLGISRDITERKKLENYLKEASFAKSMFLAQMSHEIRTPMNSILGLSELMLNHEMSTQVRFYNEKVVENAKGLLQIINDILDISKIETGKIELEKEPFNMLDIFSQCKNSVMTNAIEKAISVEFNIDQKCKETIMIGDPTRIRQILINIVSNAVKFTDKGYVKVRYDIIKEENNKRTFKCEISDSGIGMSPEQVDRIFEPFMQADSSITRKYGGTGLGLTIVKNLLSLMDSNLIIDSTLGKGTKISFELTLETMDISQLTKNGYKINYSIEEKPTFKGSVLVFEDNIMNQIVIKEHLSNVGLEMVLAENGREGLNILNMNEKNFDLIFMDIYMPIMDGLEATTRILELGITTPIIALTANVMQEDRDMYKKQGISGYLGKPFTSQELWSCLLKYLKPEKTVQLETKNEEKLLNTLRIMFLKDNKTTFEDFYKNIRKRDIKNAHLIVHTLKSTSAQIGLDYLSQTSKTIESLLKKYIKEGKEDKVSIPDNLLEKFKNELEYSLTHLERIIEKPTENQVKNETNEGLYDILEEIYPLLQSNNTKSLHYVEKLAAYPDTDNLCEQIESLEFEEALITIDKMKT